jgi:hypothetical protein
MIEKEEEEKRRSKIMNAHLHSKWKNVMCERIGEHQKGYFKRKNK